MFTIKKKNAILTINTLNKKLPVNRHTLMGIITRIEEKIADLVEQPFRQGRHLDLVSVEITLKRLMERHRKPVFSRTYVFPSYIIILDENIFTENEPFLTRFKEHLKSNIENWLHEKGYEAPHPVNIFFRKDALTGRPFEVRIFKESSETQPYLLHMESGVLFSLNLPVTIIGRGKDCRIFLSDATVSRKHAQIVYKNGKYFMTDLESINGTRINQKRISTSRLHDGDLIQFGDVVCLYREMLG
ncbi:MAG: hypothetical protein BWK74_05900 [Desulfobacteraceae bacterium A6]|nr:MAG: hypothetical protein BWK74_05900 [Desulfobacteraceae bacterium A6]